MGIVWARNLGEEASQSRSRHDLMDTTKPRSAEQCSTLLTLRVFRAIDDTHSKVAACKVINLFISPTLGHGTPNVKELQKEVQVHKALKNEYILGFVHSEVVDREREQEGWVPGLYMILELAVGGDLFDKIGTSKIPSSFLSFSCGSRGACTGVLTGSSRYWSSGRSREVLLCAAHVGHGKFPHHIRRGLS